MTIMLWGVTTERVQEWARQQDGWQRAQRRGRLAGRGRGPARAWCGPSIRSRDVRDGEILVCGSTSPAWAPIFSKIRATVTDVGRRDVARRDRVPRVRPARRGRYRPRHGRRSAPARRSASTAPTGLVTLLAVTGYAARAAAAHRLRRSDEPSFGGKSAGLGELLAAGIPVPAGFAISTAAFHAFVHEAGLQTGSRARWRECRPAISTRSGGRPMPSARRCGSRPSLTALREEVSRLRVRSARRANLEPPVAVRSSAVGEDSHEATFAGQQETYLWVRGAEQRVSTRCATAG